MAKHQIQAGAPLRKTYAEKLRDPRWAEFRKRIISSRGKFCEMCGSEAGEKTTNVHHRRYISGAEPWEYKDEDVILLCESCHNAVHRCETKWRDMIRQMPPFMVHEFSDMADAFQGMPAHRVRIWACYCKNEARKLADRKP